MDQQSIFTVILVITMLFMAGYFTNVYVQNVSKAPIYACYYVGVESRDLKQIREIYPNTVCGPINNTTCPEGFTIGKLDRMQVIHGNPS